MDTFKKASTSRFALLVSKNVVFVEIFNSASVISIIQMIIFLKPTSIYMVEHMTISRWKTHLCCILFSVSEDSEKTRVCCLFVFSASCALCQCLLIVHSWLSLRVSLMLMIHHQIWHDFNLRNTTTALSAEWTTYPLDKAEFFPGF